MNTKQAGQYLVCVLLAGLGVVTAVPGRAEESVLRSSHVADFPQWQGRAGGLVGADRIAAVTRVDHANTAIQLTYDKDVASRTNMARGQNDATGNGVSVSYDQDVSARTNMARTPSQTPSSVASQQ